MMVDLMEAFCANRLRITSSRSVFKKPEASFVNHTTLQITAADCSFVCSLSPSTVMLVLDDIPRSAVVTANSFGDNGVWIQVSCHSFWMELYVPNTAAVAARGGLPQQLQHA
jgi:hypothetical protein